MQLPQSSLAMFTNVSFVTLALAASLAVTRLASRDGFFRSVGRLYSFCVRAIMAMD